MQMLEDSLYLENIQEYVHDEDKIVSYKWLSRKLEVPVNVAKQMLYAYVSRCRSSEECTVSPITVTYILSGVVERNGNKDHHVCLVDEDNLEATREQFHCVLGVHIFSIQKVMPKGPSGLVVTGFEKILPSYTVDPKCWSMLQENSHQELSQPPFQLLLEWKPSQLDSGVLYAADYEVNRTHLENYSRWNTIECPTVPLPQSPKPPSKPAESSSERTMSSRLPRLSHMEEDIEPAKEEATAQTVPPLTEVHVKAEKKPAQPKKGISKQKVQAKGSVASFFAKQGDKTGEVKSAPEPPSSEKQSRAKQVIVISPKKSPVKSPAKSPRKRGRPTKKSKPPKKAMAGMFQGLHDSDIEDDSDFEPPAEEPPAESRKEKSHRKTAKAGTSKGPVKQALPKNGGTQRKHKRVQNLSSDEEMSAEENGKAKIHAEITPVHVKRRRKLVTKMYVNDEGAMVTEKVWESGSEDDSVPMATSATTDSSREPELPQTLKPEKLSPMRSSKGAKQASLMSFFKK